MARATSRRKRLPVLMYQRERSLSWGGVAAGWHGYGAGSWQIRCSTSSRNQRVYNLLFYPQGQNPFSVLSESQQSPWPRWLGLTRLAMLTPALCTLGQLWREVVYDLEDTLEFSVFLRFLNKTKQTKSRMKKKSIFHVVFGMEWNPWWFLEFQKGLS